MHIMQLVLVMLKATFAEIGGVNFAFRYVNDFEQTGIIIDTEFNKESGAYGKKPALVVARGAVNSQQIAMGDRSSQSIPTQNSTKTSLVHSSVDVRILSKSSVEVDLLGNEVLNFLVSCRTLFPSMLGLHQVSNPTLTAISTLEQDDTMYYATATMSFLMQYKWRHLVPQNILNSLHLYINDELNYILEPPA